MSNESEIIPKTESECVTNVKRMSNESEIIPKTESECLTNVKRKSNECLTKVKSYPKLNLNV